MENGFADRLKKTLREKNMTMNELAEKSGLTLVTIARLANGTRGKTLEKLPKMARALGVSIDALFPEMDAPQEDTALQTAEPTTDERDDLGDLE